MSHLKRALGYAALSSQHHIERVKRCSHPVEPKSLRLALLRWCCTARSNTTWFNLMFDWFQAPSKSISVTSRVWESLQLRRSWISIQLTCCRQKQQVCPWTDDFIFRRRVTKIKYLSPSLLRLFDWVNQTNVAVVLNTTAKLVVFTFQKTPSRHSHCF